MQYLKHLGRLAALRRRILKFFYPLWSVFASKKKVDAINAESIRAAQAGNGELTILVHGILTNYYSGVYWAVRWFRRAGIHVVSLGYNYNGDLATSAEEVKYELDKFRSLPGIKTINIVGISLGGMVARYYIEALAGKDVVSKLVTVFTPLVPPKEGEFNLAALMEKVFGSKSITEVTFEQSWEIGDRYSVPHLALYGTSDWIAGKNAHPLDINFGDHVMFVPVSGGHTLVSYNVEAMDLALQFILGGKERVSAALKR